MNASQAGQVRTSAVFAAGTSGLLFGFDTAVIAGVTRALTDTFQLTAATLGMTVSAALFGTLLGALIAGKPGDRYGSRSVLIWVAIAYALSAAGCALSGSLWLFLAFRLLNGFAIGASSVLAPVYIAEISPPARRGMLVGSFQLSIVVGILAAYCSNALIGWMTDASWAWRLKLGVALIPALLLFGLLLRIPESPRWLLQKGRSDHARDAAAWLRMDDVDALLKRSVAPVGDSARLSWRQHRRPILLAVALAAFNQLSGINAILYYLDDIFAAAGFSALSAGLQSVAIGVGNLIATLIGMAMIDRFGRKPLLMTGAIGTAVALGAIAVIYATGQGYMLLLPALIVFILFFAASQGAVIWVYLSEIFPTSVRARGQAVGSATHWLLNAIIAFGFPIVGQWSRAVPFTFFAVAMLVQFVVVARIFPETRGRSLDDAEPLLTNRVVA